jgi:hypothetical protein
MLAPIAAIRENRRSFIIFEVPTRSYQSQMAVTCVKVGRNYDLPMIPPRSYYPRDLVRAICLLGLLVVSAVPVAAQTPAETLRVRTLNRDGQVLVTFSLNGGLTDEMKAVVQSGLRTVFSYTVEL